MSKNKRTSYVVELNETQILKLENVLKNAGWEFSTLQYTHWKAKIQKCNVVAYNSGKVTVQGAGTEDFVTFILEPQITLEAKFGYEDILFKDAEDDLGELIPFPHAGIDESGKGDFFGPLVVACVFVSEDTKEKLRGIGVQDSKAIKSDAKIAKLSSQIKKICQDQFAVIAIGNESYNNMYNNIQNLNKLLAWGHSRTLENLLEKVPECNSVLVDKFARNDAVVKNALLEKGKKIKVVQKTKAEQDIAVAAASILARDGFVKKMKAMSDEFKIEFPKGCNKRVEAAGKQFIKKYNEDDIAKVAKLHFKTLNKILK